MEISNTNIRLPITMYIIEIIYEFFHEKCDFKKACSSVKVNKQQDIQKNHQHSIYSFFLTSIGLTNY